MDTATLPKPVYAVGYRDYRRQHLYTVNGLEYPSVTKILNIVGGGKTNALVVWARRAALKLAESELVAELTQGRTITAEVLGPILARADRQPDKIKDDAADIGGRVHAAIDDYIAGKTPKPEPDAKPGFDNFMAWLSHEGLEIIAGDTVVASVQHGYGGRVGAIARSKSGGFIILDWKTSNAMREEYPLQVSAYAQAFSETYGVPLPDSAWVIRFGKTGPDFETKKVNIPVALTGWLAAVKLYNAMHGGLWIA